MKYVLFDKEKCVKEIIYSPKTIGLDFPKQFIRNSSSRYTRNSSDFARTRMIE